MPLPSSYDAPPAYTNEDYQKAVEEIKQKAATQPGFKEKIQGKFLEAASSDENLKEIQKGVDEFTKNITVVNAAFEEIRDKLHQVDEKKYKRKDGTTYEGEEKWKGLREQWRSLLAKSQDTAIKSIARLQDFQLLCDGSLKIQEIGDQRYKDTITELDNFVAKPDPTGDLYDRVNPERQATTHTKIFDDLREGVEDFSSDFDTFAEYQKVEIGKDITDLQTKIRNIQVDISFDAQMILDLGVALGVTIFGTLAGGVVAAGMGPLSPAAIIVLVIGALLAAGEAAALAYFVADYFTKVSQRDGWIADKEKLEGQIAALNAIQSNLTDGKDNLRSLIVGQVDLLQHVWHVISNEGQLIMEMLKSAKDKTTLSYFQDQISKARDTYKALTNCLEKFSNA